MQDGSSNELKWWEIKESTRCAAAVFAVISKIRFNDRNRMTTNDDCMTVYGNYTQFPRLNWNSNTSIGSRKALPKLREKFNVTSSCVDTVGSKISQMKPVITFLTEGGDWKQKRMGQNLGQFMRGLFYQNDIYNQHQKMFQDGNILDLGSLKHYRIGNKIYTERVMSFDLGVEDIDAMYGDPRRLYQTKIMSKAAAKRMWPKFKTQIQDAKSGIEYGTFVNTEDQVCIIEAWHQPSEEGGDDGRHVICVDTTVVFDEKWKRCSFPFTFHRWAYSGVGFWGQSLAERLLPNQLSINRMLSVLQQSFHLGSTYKVFLEYGSKVMKDHISNQIGSIVYYQGTPPQIHAPSVIDPQYKAHLDWLIQGCYQEAGISELAAKAEKPSGLDSRVAMREFNDLQTERFVIVSQRYEQSFLETARQYIYLCQEIAAEGLTIKSNSQSRTFIKKIDWKDVAVEQDGFLMKMFPTSMLPHTPAGQLASIQDWIEAGIMPQEYAMQMLDWPDLKSYKSLATSAIEDIENTIESLLDGTWVAPEPFQDLNLGVKMVQSAYLYWRHEGVDRNALDLLIEWMRIAEDMMQKSQQATMATQDMAGAAAQGAQSQPPQAAQAPVPQ